MCSLDARSGAEVLLPILLIQLLLHDIQQCSVKKITTTTIKNSNNNDKCSAAFNAYVVDILFHKNGNIK